MKRLLLSSSSIKPVNIRIVSNGVQCADLKMLKENLCISDIKDVLDGRLVNWLNNIGEKDLADKIKEIFPTPDNINEHEYEFCELFFDKFNLKEYHQVLLKEKSDNLFSKEIKKYPDLIVEAYNLCPTKYPLAKWLDIISMCFGYSDEFKELKATIKRKINEENINKTPKNKEQENTNKKTLEETEEDIQIEYFSKFLRSIFNCLTRKPQYGMYAKDTVQKILDGYKGAFNTKYYNLANYFKSSFEVSIYYDRPKTEKAIDIFLKRYNLTRVKI